MNKHHIFNLIAGGEGFEPPHTDSESAVLPLDEPPISVFYFTTPLVISPEILIINFYFTSVNFSRSVIDFLILSIVLSFPIISILSNKGGLTFLPVTATLNIPNT